MRYPQLLAPRWVGQPGPVPPRRRHAHGLAQFEPNRARGHPVRERFPGGTIPQGAEDDVPRDGVCVSGTELILDGPLKLTRAHAESVDPVAGCKNEKRPALRSEYRARFVEWTYARLRATYEELTL